MKLRWAWRDQLLVVAPATILVVIAFVVAFQWVKPAPPSRVVIATGRADGAYYQFAQQYRTRLAREGITLDVRETSGSVENIRLLQDPRNNRGVAVIRIEDPKGGAEGYTFDIEWSGGMGGVNNGSTGNRPGNAPPGRGNNRYSTDDAIDACRNEVRARGERDYNLRNIQVNSVAADRGPAPRIFRWQNSGLSASVPVARSIR